MISVSSDLKTRTKKIKQQNIKLNILENELTVKEVHFMPVKIFNSLPVWKLRKQKEVIAKEVKFSFDGKLFKTIMKQIDITVKNASEIKGKNVNFQYGLYIEDSFEYVDLGDFYIKDVEDDKAKEELEVTGYDKMLNFMVPFKQSDLQLTYPCTMATLVQKMAEVCGVEVYSLNFFNSDLIVDEDFFTAQELTYRDVLEKVAEATLTVIFIKDNKLYICKPGSQVVQKLDKTYLTDLLVKEKFGPVNALVLGRGDVEDNVEAKDEASITQNGRCEIRFDENEFVEYKREEVINEMFNEVKGLEYYSFEGSDVGVIWLEPGDLIEVADREENPYKTFYLKANITINTGISSDIEADIPEETDTEYKVTTKEEKKTLKVERLAKKNEGLIQDLILETGKYNKKFVEIQASLDGISQTVESMEDFTREKTQVENLYLEDIAEGEGYVLKFIIYGNSAYFTSNVLTICTSTKPRGYGENVYIETESGEELITEEEQEFVIGTKSFYVNEFEITLYEPLRSITIENETHYDTLEIAQDGTMQIVRRVGVNNEGDCYLLDNEIIEIIEEKFIIPSLKGGIYYFVEEYPYLQYYANYIIENEYSDAFLTKIELGTYITQNAEAIRVAWNQISQYLQMEGIDGKATLNIYNQNNNMLMSLSQDGQTFYDENGNILGTIGIVREEQKDILAFSMPVDWESVDTSRSMAWGIVDPNGSFLPIFYLAGYYGEENSEYGGQLIVEGELAVNILKLANALTFGQHTGGINWGENSDKYIMPVLSNDNEWLTYKAPYGHEFFVSNDSCLVVCEEGISIKHGGEEYLYISKNNYNIWLLKPLFIRVSGNSGYTGYPMIGIDTSHKYNVWWSGDTLFFYVDGTYVNGISDKRLKSDFQEIDDNFLNAIEELKIQQFKCQNRNGQISFGIIAQDLIEVFEKYNINPENYEILKKVKYDLSDETEYYAIEYTQFLVLKQLATDRKIKELKEKDKQKDEIIKNLIERIEKLEEAK